MRINRVARRTTVRRGMRIVSRRLVRRGTYIYVVEEYDNGSQQEFLTTTDKNGNIVYTVDGQEEIFN